MNESFPKVFIQEGIEGFLLSRVEQVGSDALGFEVSDEINCMVVGTTWGKFLVQAVDKDIKEAMEVGGDMVGGFAVLFLVAFLGELGRFGKSGDLSIVLVVWF